MKHFLLWTFCWHFFLGPLENSGICRSKEIAEADSIAVSSESNQVRVSILSIFRPKEVWIRGTPFQKVKFTSLAEDGHRDEFVSPSLQIYCGGKAPLFLVSNQRKFWAAKVEARPIKLDQQLKVGVPKGPTREYAGWIEIQEQNGLCLVINHIALDEYSQDVACHEIRGAGPEALRAQTIAVRSYSQVFSGKHQEEGFDYCDLTHCQAYTGHGSCTAGQRKSIEIVNGISLLYQDRPAEAYYFSTCSGHTAAADEVWGKPLNRPYLMGVKDGEKAYCSHSDHFQWRFEVNSTDLCSQLANVLPKLGKGPCQIEIEKTGMGGWVSKVLIENEQSVLLGGDQFHLLLGRIYGWSKFKSAKFRIESNQDRLVFIGQGLGHGVGMCQFGAMGMEKAGANYVEILKHYFPGTQLGNWP